MNESKLKNIKGIITDIDGVLTDGKIIIHDDGSESKEFNVKDGQMIVWAQRHLGIKFGAVSGRGGNAVETRLEQLNFDFRALHCTDKTAAFEECLRKWNMTADQIMYIGDDFPDIPLLKKAGVGVCPADANDYVSEFAHYKTRAAGGKGVLREVLSETAVRQLGREKITEIISRS